MKQIVIGLVLATLMVTLAPGNTAAAESIVNPVRPLVHYKDPLIAGYLSATLPGLGQVYSGHKGRGFLILLGVGASFGTAAGLFEPAKLKLSDYDRTDFGGDGDGLLSISEVANWEEKKYEDDAFSVLSGGRKAGIIGAGALGLGLYIWNILDARTLTREHNRESRFSVGPLITPGSTGAAISLRF